MTAFNQKVFAVVHCQTIKFYGCEHTNAHRISLSLYHHMIQPPAKDAWSVVFLLQISSIVGKQDWKCFSASLRTILTMPRMLCNGNGAISHCKLKWDLLRTSVTACTIDKNTYLAPFGTFYVKMERVIYLKRKPYKVPFESNIETGRIFVMKGSKWVLVKVVLFQLSGHGHPQDDAMTNFFADSKCPILGLSNEVSFVPEFFCKDGENKGNVFPLK